MHATLQRVCPAAALAAFVSLALAAGPIGASSPSPTPTPTPSLPGWIDEPVRSRDVACSAAVTNTPSPASVAVIEEHLVCSIEMTDPMASGELSAHIIVTFEPAAAPAGTWTGTFKLARDDGSWTGAGHGVAFRALGSGAPALYGQVDYQGSGDCAGLFYRQLLAGEDTPPTLSGWIYGPMLRDPHWWLADLPTLWVDAIILGSWVL